jgi:hypothetical protein
MKIYGRDLKRRAFESLVGRPGQLAGIERLVYSGGVAQGVDVLRMVTGGALQYDVLPTRGLDIGRLDFLGVPLAWQSMNGIPHPAFYDRQGIEWLRTAAGGFVMSCGMTQVGWSGRAETSGEGLHGRAHHLPCWEINTTECWEGDELILEVSGTIRQARMFGENLSRRRSIRSVVGTSRLTLTDVYRNEGFSPSPLMMLYHFNLGFPFVTPKMRIEFPSEEIFGRDDIARRGNPLLWTEPDPEFEEQVFYHYRLRQDPTGWTEVRLVQPEFPSGPHGNHGAVMLKLGWETHHLPHFVQWKMCGAGVHTLGIEPANCGVGGLDEERGKGTVRVLEPGEEIEVRLAVELSMDGLIG